MSQGPVLRVHSTLRALLFSLDSVHCFERYVIYPSITIDREDVKHIYWYVKREFRRCMGHDLRNIDVSIRGIEKRLILLHTSVCSL